MYDKERRGEETKREEGKVLCVLERLGHHKGKRKRKRERKRNRKQIRKMNDNHTSLPTTSKPATAKAIAESPSVSTNVHFEDLFVPAQ